MPKVKRLFWDLETSPNIGMFWRAGYKQTIPHDNIIQERAIICCCYKWEGEKKVHAIEWDKGCDKDLCSSFAEVANAADELVAHNGDKFDLKWFNTRNLMHGLPPLPEYKTVDTLVIARRRFYFNSNRLDYVAKALGMDGKTATHFGMWRDILLHNCPKAMREMVRYCKHDVALLEEVWKQLQAYHKPKTHAGVHAGLDKWTCPHCASENVYKSKTRHTTAGTIQHQMQCQDCHRYYTINDKAFREYSEAKIGVAL